MYLTTRAEASQPKDSLVHSELKRDVNKTHLGYTRQGEKDNTGYDKRPVFDQYEFFNAGRFKTPFTVYRYLHTNGYH